MSPREAILVTGAGGAAGVSVIRALKAAGHRVIGADLDPLAAGLGLVDEQVLLPPFSDHRFADALCREASAHKVTSLVSTMAEEMVAIANASADLSSAGVAHWVPHPEAVHACIDKWSFAQVLRASALPAPATGLGAADGVPGPWIVKPRFGRGSRDVYPVEDPNELDWALRRVAHPLVQTRLTGSEFTVDALVDRSGVLVGAVPRWRLETKAGISTKGRTFHDPGLVAQVARLLRELGLRGAANVQGFVGEGGVSFVEVNPRFSGGLPLSLAAGADLVGEYLRGIQGRPMRPHRLRFRPGVVMSRYYEEIFTEDEVGADQQCRAAP